MKSQQRGTLITKVPILRQLFARLLSQRPFGNRQGLKTGGLLLLAGLTFTISPVNAAVKDIQAGEHHTSEKKERLVPKPEKKERIVPMPEKKERIVPKPEKKERIVPMPEKKERIVPMPEKKERIVPKPEKKERIVPMPEKKEPNEAHTMKNGAHIINLMSGQTMNNINFGNTRTPERPPEHGGIIQGLKWNDLNGDGKIDVGEPGLAGVIIYLDLNDDGVLGGNEPYQITDKQGHYRFSNLRAATYVIREQVPDGYRQTYPPVHPPVRIVY